MTAAREQTHEGRLDGLGAEVERRNVSLQMVDGDERDASRPRDRLRGREADQEGADETGPAGDADARHSWQILACHGESLSDDRADELQVAT